MSKNVTIIPPSQSKPDIIVRYDSVQRTFLLSQGVEVHVIVVCDGLDLGQVEGGQPDGGGHEDRL